jgi:hypothetical protein
LTTKSTATLLRVWVFRQRCFPAPSGIPGTPEFRGSYIHLISEAGTRADGDGVIAVGTHAPDTKIGYDGGALLFEVAG